MFQSIGSSPSISLLAIESVATTNHTALRGGQEKNNDSKVILSRAISILIILGIVGYGYYQNYKYGQERRRAAKLDPNNKNDPSQTPDKTKDFALKKLSPFPDQAGKSDPSDL